MVHSIQGCMLLLLLVYVGLLARMSSAQGSGGALLDKPEDVNCTLDGAHHIIWMLTNLLDEVTMDTNSYSGNYTCTAVNQLTSVSRTFKASVIAQPAQPAQPVILLPGMMAMSTTINAFESIINWPSPPNKLLLMGFQVNYENRVIVEVESRQRRRRQATTAAPPSIGVVTVSDVNAVSATIPTCSYCSVTAKVNVVYKGGATAPLVAPVTFTSPESKPTVTRNLDITSTGVNTLSCSWDHPSPTNGIITSYSISYHRSVDSGNQAMVTRLAGNATTYKISNLDPGTKYMVYVFATNSVDNGDSTPGVPGYTSFGVASPSIISLVVSESALDVTFNVSRLEGDVQEYQIIVSLVNISDSTSKINIPPYSSSTKSLYVTRVGTLGNDVTTVQAMIGTGETSTSAVTGTQHVDQQLDENIDYYIIIRCFSRINTTVFNDSTISSAISFSLPGDSNTVLVIVLTLAVAGVLIIFLLVVLSLAYLYCKRKIAATKKTQDDDYEAVRKVNEEKP